VTAGSSGSLGGLGFEYVDDGAGIGSDLGLGLVSPEELFWVSPLTCKSSATARNELSSS